MSKHEVKKSKENPTQDHAFKKLGWHEHLQTRIVGMFLLFLIIIVSSTAWIMFNIFKQDRIDDRLNYIQELSNTTVSDINQKITIVQNLAITIADISESVKDREQLRTLIPHLLNHPEKKSIITGGGIWYEPESFISKNLESYSWIRQADDELKFIPQPKITPKKPFHRQAWYAPAVFLPQHRTYWTPSFIDPSTKEAMISCVAPMYKNGIVIGAVSVEFRLQSIKKLIKEVKHFEDGYFFTLDSNNHFITWPKENQTTRVVKDNHGIKRTTSITLNELIKSEPMLNPVSQEITKFENHKLTTALKQTGKTAYIAKLINQRCPSISIEHSKIIAARIATHSDNTEEINQLLLDKVPNIIGPAKAWIYYLPNTAWKIVVAYPLRHVYKSAEVTVLKISIYLVCIELAALLLMLYILKRILLRPIRKIITATATIPLGDTNTKNQLDTQVRSELGEIGHLFNLRTYQMSTAYKSIKDNSLLLEQRVEERTEELKRTHDELLDVSRKAGMSEIATSVLHNVGNVLNSVNISAAMIGDQIANSRLSDFTKAVQILHEHQDDIAVFLTEDPQGKHLNAFFQALNKQLHHEQNEINKELGEMNLKIDHIKEIVQTQQTYARVGAVTVNFKPHELINDALRILATPLSKTGVKIINTIPELPIVTGEKQKILEIIINLIKNAHDALASNHIKEPQITFDGSIPKEGFVQISVTDNGTGISDEAKEKIFQHGFTTKATGNGFGLHRSINSANEMGGKLSVVSEGVNKGACFTLILPTTYAKVEQ